MSKNQQPTSSNTKLSNNKIVHHYISELDLFWSALMFYTRLPAPKNLAYSDDALNQSRKYFPFIGIIIGTIASCVYLICQSFFSNDLSVALSMVATILATGAFHEDGFADSCDGLGGGWKAEQVLIIMKDSRIGTYATVGLICLLGIKFLSLLDLSTTSITTFVFTYITAHTLSRLSSSLIIEQYNYVQDIEQSKAKPVTQKKLTSPDLHQTLIISAIPCLISLFVAFIPTIFAIIACFLIAKLFARYSNKRINGYTGDILGAIQQLSEVTFYLVFIALL